MAAKVLNIKYYYLKLNKIILYFYLIPIINILFDAKITLKINGFIKFWDIELKIQDKNIYYQNCFTTSNNESYVPVIVVLLYINT